MNETIVQKILTPGQSVEMLRTLRIRFEAHLNRHEGLGWNFVQTRLQAHPEKLWSLSERERTGGEPDVIGYDKQAGELIFYDCSEQSPTKILSWIQTPADIRKLGGALFADRRYNTVFVYHNGASSYYSVRAFRGCLRV